MLLRDLFPTLKLDAHLGEQTVLGLSADSRKIKAGFVFFAIPGTKVDGLSFAQQAAQQGALAIIAAHPAPPQIGNVPLIGVEDVRLALAQAAARFYPRQPATIAAVTGTSGKTSVSVFTRQIWAHLGHAAAALGTTGLIAPSGATYGSLTTPDPVTLHQTLDQLAQDGVTHLVMEASSHGLDQYRLDGVRLSAAAFTNLSRDHLDYHPTIEAYLSAKLRLFDTLLQPGQAAVIDADSDSAARVIAACTQRGLKIFTIGRQGKDLHLIASRATTTATHVQIEWQGQRHEITVPLSSDFMVSNALVAAGLAIVTGGAPVSVFHALETLTGAPGRLEKIATYHQAPIFVDYAHKPDALEKVLQALRPLTTGRLILVFGCGGDRDQGKRPLMGEIAARLADVVIITDDNPRSEDPALIRRAILAAAPKAQEIGDRATAIAAAIDLLQEGDALIIAGKGHETGQIIGTQTLPFSDHEVIRAFVKEKAA